MIAYIDTNKRQIHIVGSFHYHEFKDFWETLPEVWQDYRYVHEAEAPPSIILLPNPAYPVVPVAPWQSPFSVGDAPAAPEPFRVTCGCGDNCGCSTSEIYYKDKTR